MWLSTHYFSGFLQDWFHVFLYEIKKNSVWYNFYQGTSVSITFYIFEHYQLWMMDSKGQRVFFPKTPQLCVWHTEVRRCYHFKLVSHFQLWFPIWGVLVNRLIKSNPKKVTLHINNMLIIVYIAIQAKQISTCLFNFIVALPEQFSAGLCFEQFDVIYIRDCQVREDFSFTCCLILCEMQVFFYPLTYMLQAWDALLWAAVVTRLMGMSHHSFFIVSKAQKKIIQSYAQ